MARMAPGARKKQKRHTLKAKEKTESVDKENEAKQEGSNMETTEDPKDAKLEALNAGCKKRRLRAPQNHVPEAQSFVKAFEGKSSGSSSLERLLDDQVLRALEGTRQWRPILGPLKNDKIKRDKLHRFGVKLFKWAQPYLQRGATGNKHKASLPDLSKGQAKLLELSQMTSFIECYQDYLLKQKRGKLAKGAREAVEDSFMQGMGTSESAGTKRRRLKDAVLANANANLEKEADPDSVMSAVLPTFTASQPVQPQGQKDFTSQFAALKAKARSTPPSYETAIRSEVQDMKKDIAELKEIIMLSFADKK